MPHANEGLKGTALKGESFNVGLFDDKKWVHITIIKRDKELWMECRHPDKTALFHLVNHDKPPIRAGRVGLRLMQQRESHFRNFKISVRTERDRE